MTEAVVNVERLGGLYLQVTTVLLYPYDVAQCQLGARPGLEATRTFQCRIDRLGTSIFVRNFRAIDCDCGGVDPCRPQGCEQVLNHSDFTIASVDHTAARALNDMLDCQGNEALPGADRQSAARR